MVTKDNRLIKIIDFGSCKDLNGTEFEEQIKERNKKDKRKRPDFEHYVGTPNYMAPECVHNKESTKKADMFSLGCLLYQLYFGFPPFMGKSEYLIYLKSTKCEYSLPSGIISEEAERIIRNLIQLEPESRSGIDELLSNPYFEFTKTEIDIKQEYPFDSADKYLIKVASALFPQYGIDSTLKSLPQNLYSELELIQLQNPYCKINDLLYNLVLNYFKEHLKDAKNTSNSLDSLLKEQKQLNADSSYQEAKEKTKEDIEKEQERHEKIYLLTIKVTNDETVFDHEFSKVKLAVESAKSENADDVLYKFWTKKFKLLRSQIEHEIFNIDIDFTRFE